MKVAGCIRAAWHRIEGVFEAMLMCDRDTPHRKMGLSVTGVGWWVIRLSDREVGTIYWASTDDPMQNVFSGQLSNYLVSPLHSE